MLRYVLCQATMTKYHWLGGFNNTNLFFHYSGGQRPEIRVPILLVQKNSPRGLQMAAFLLCAHMSYPQCMYVDRDWVLLRILIPLQQALLSHFILITSHDTDSEYRYFSSYGFNKWTDKHMLALLQIELLPWFHFLDYVLIL